MKTRITAFLILLFLFTSGSIAHARNVEWENLNNEARSLYQKGQYDQAIVLVNKALDVAKKEWGNDHPNVAQTLNNLGLIYQDQGRYAQAETLYKRSLEIWEKSLDPIVPQWPRG